MDGSRRSRLDRAPDDGLAVHGRAVAAAARSAPTMVLGPFAGIVADRVSRAHLRCSSRRPVASSSRWPYFCDVRRRRRRILAARRARKARSATSEPRLPSRDGRRSSACSAPRGWRSRPCRSTDGGAKICRSCEDGGLRSSPARAWRASRPPRATRGCSPRSPSVSRRRSLRRRIGGCCRRRARRRSPRHARERPRRRVGELPDRAHGPAHHDRGERKLLFPYQPPPVQCSPRTSPQAGRARSACSSPPTASGRWPARSPSPRTTAVSRTAGCSRRPCSVAPFHPRRLLGVTDAGGERRR